MPLVSRNGTECGMKAERCAALSTLMLPCFLQHSLNYDFQGPSFTHETKIFLIKGSKKKKIPLNCLFYACLQRFDVIIHQNSM